MHRRTLLTVIGSIFVSGCSYLGNSCPLSYSIFSPDDAGTIEEEYEYSTLSKPAQKAFKKAKEANGEVRIKDTSANRAKEFSYTDVVTYYTIVYNDKEYILGSWSGENCS